MKPPFALVSLVLVSVGCGGPVARLDRLSRVEAAVLTDANSFAANTRATARPPVQLNDPDRLAALERFLKSKRGSWKKVEGTPRATRFQLQLIGNDRPMFTVWMEPGYIAMAEGKAIQETRLSNEETAELLACLGLPPDYLNASPVMPGAGALPPLVPSHQPTSPQQPMLPASAIEPGPGRTGSMKLGL